MHLEKSFSSSGSKAGNILLLEISWSELFLAPVTTEPNWV
jgi:hypothetical protein